MRTFLFIAFSLLIFSGCVHDPTRPHLTNLAPGAPDVGTILDDITANTDALNSLEGTGIVRLSVPGSDGIQNFRTGFIQFERPDRFFFRGRKGTFVVQVYVEGDRFLLDLPSRDVFYYGRQGDRFDDLDLDVAPSRIVQELFFLNVLGDDGGGKVEVTAYDEASSTAELSVYADEQGRKLQRRVVVRKEGTWRVTGVSVYGPGEALIAETVCTGYEEIDGVVTPMDVKSVFPDRHAEMEYNLSATKTRVNTDGLRPVATLDEARAALLADGVAEVLGQPGGERVR
tara:strand:- start:1074 stop:1928 length:855 start_codon:yes stop_codon:yes gene_type:complete